MILKEINQVIGLVQSVVRLPGHLADRAWEWAARKVMPLDDTQPWANWEDEVL